MLEEKVSSRFLIYDFWFNCADGKNYFHPHQQIRNQQSAIINKKNLNELMDGKVHQAVVSWFLSLKFEFHVGANNYLPLHNIRFNISERYFEIITMFYLGTGH